MRTVDMDTYLPELEPPSPQEALRFYAGLPGKPRLVARAFSNRPSWLPVEGDPQPLQAINVAHMYIAEPWITPRRDPSDPTYHQPSLQNELEVAINRLPWHSIEIVEFGLPFCLPSNQDDIICWIGIGIGSHLLEPWPIIADTMRAVRQVLDMRNLSFIDIQIWEPTLQIDISELDAALLSNPGSQQLLTGSSFAP